MKHVPHLLLPGPWPDAAIPLDDSQRHHLTRVLRRQGGSDVTYTDGQGLLASGRLEREMIERGQEHRVSRSRIVQAVVAPPTDRDRQRFAVEKLAELGVARLSWLTSRFGQGRPPRLDRAAAWARAALEQSRGAWLMEIDSTPVSLAQLDGSDVVVCDRSGSPDVPKADELTYVVGPEGGWAPEEIPAGWSMMSLGDRVLRVETAAVAAAVLLVHRS